MTKVVGGGGEFAIKISYVKMQPSSYNTIPIAIVH